ncbi:hypothetical protein K4F52_001150 [Lecanicillium sp. MT-2017a]|nr:hypothetical protein K4F52_001150 [Lecanicillium sp. MT-2017a]
MPADHTADTERQVVVRQISPNCFPRDPRYEQMRTINVRPKGRVIGNEARDSSRLLNLPNEILWRIVAFAAEEQQWRCLSAFALTSRECRQLARPYQFADLCINRSERSWDLLRHLKKESETRHHIEMTIGECVRSLTIIVDRDLMEDDGTAAFNEIEEEWEEYWQGLIDDLGHVLERALPNLDRVFWMDTGELHVQPRLLPAVLQRIASPNGQGRIRELYFADYKFLFNNPEDVPLTLSGNGPPLELSSLALGYDQVPSAYSDAFGCTAYFAETLLRRSASTLESLAWNGSFAGDLSPDDTTGFTTLITLREGPIAFTKLRKFWCSLSKFQDIQPSVLECFLASPCLESFSPSGHLCSIMLANDMPGRFPLPQLRTFAVSCISGELDYGEMADYVDKALQVAGQYGPRIEELFIYLAEDIDTLENRPSLSLEILTSHLSSGKFCNLRSLCFSWVQDPDLQLLRSIGSHIHTLEELSFNFRPYDDRAGTGPISNYNIQMMGCPADQDIIAAISPLTSLVRLAIFGDEYIADWCGNHWSWHKFFKEHVWFHQGRSRLVRPDGDGDVEAGSMHGHTRTGDSTEDWTSWVTGNAEDPRAAVVHRAEEYAKALPHLKEFICGRVLVEITDRG